MQAAVFAKEEDNCLVVSKFATVGTTTQPRRFGQYRVARVERFDITALLHL